MLAIFTCIPGEAKTSGNELVNNHIKPGFSCSKGHSNNERLICSDPDLSRIDYELSLLYAQAKLAMRNSASFKKTNDTEWLWRENNCHDRQCLLNWYANRHNQLVDALTHEGKNPSTSSASTSLSKPDGDETSQSVTSAESSSLNGSKPPHPQPTEPLSQTIITLPLVQTPRFWLIAIGLIIAISIAWELFGSDKETRKRMRLLAAAVNSNISEFLEQQSQSDLSGDTQDLKKWDKEKRQFIENMIKPALTDCTPLSVSEVDRLGAIIDYVAWGIKNHNRQYKFRGNLSESNGSDYVQFCSRVLKHHGWKVRIIHANKPDAYLLASRKAYAIAMVCKSQLVPVGADALREARVLQDKHRAKKAVVVSNAPFTTSVEHEADRAAALLLHHFSLSLLVPMVEL